MLQGCGCGCVLRIAYCVLKQVRDAAVGVVAYCVPPGS